MPISGNITTRTGNAPAISPSQARGDPGTYQPQRDAATGPAAPTAPIPGGPSAPMRAPLPAQAPAPAAPAEGAEAEPQREPESWRLAKVAEKDRAARARLAEAKAAEARARDLEGQIAEREARIKTWEAEEAERRRNPAKALRDYGYSPEAALQFMLNGEKLTPEQQAVALTQQQIEAERKERDAAIQALREENERRDKEREAAQAKEGERRQEQDRLAAIADFKHEIAEEVQADPENYEVVGLMGQRGVDMVFAHIDDHYAKTGQRLSLKAAISAVEQALIEDARGFAQKSRKLSGVLGPGQRPAAPRTLSNRMPAGPAAQAPAQETEAEKRERVKQMIAVYLGGGGRR